MINLYYDLWIWLDDMFVDYDVVFDCYCKVWMQIVICFKDYLNKFFFESINEFGFEGLDDVVQVILFYEVNIVFYIFVCGIGGGNIIWFFVFFLVYMWVDQLMIDFFKNIILSLNDLNLIVMVYYYGWYFFSVNFGGYMIFDEILFYWVYMFFDVVYNIFVVDGIFVIVGEFSVLLGSWI